MVAGLLRLPRIFDQDATQLAVGIARADVNGQIVGHLREHALLQQKGGDPVADLELVLAEFAGGGRHHPQIERVAEHAATTASASAGRASASGDSPAARMTVSSRSPASRW